MREGPDAEEAAPLLAKAHEPPFGPAFRMAARTTPLRLGASIAAWFAASAVCTAYAKLTLTYLRPLPCALTVTTCQFTLAASVSGLAAVALGRRPPPACRELCLVALAYTMGFLLLNASLGRLEASFTETVRGLEPLTSFALARLLGARGARLTGASAAALLALLAGAGLSVFYQPAFDISGLLLGLLANTMFSSRALLVTLLQDAARRRAGASRGGGDGEIDGLALFAAQHLLGLLLLLPAALTLEGTQCVAQLTRNAAPARSATLSAVGFGMYNFLSLLVLLMLDAVSHAVCNSCRRAVTIGASAAFFRNHISLPSGLGISLIIGGSMAYAAGSAKRAPAEAAADNDDGRDSYDTIDSTEEDGRGGAWEDESQPLAGVASESGRA